MTKLFVNKIESFVLAINVQTGEEVAIKLEHMNAKHPQLHIECKFYKIMQGGGKKIQNSTQFKNYFDMINLERPLDYHYTFSSILKYFKTFCN